MPTTDAFTGLRPDGLWQHFAAITHVPRPSRHEEKIVAHVRDWAAKHGFPLVADAAGNQCVHVPGSPGRENAPVVVLQGHLDMVCERDSDSPYDAEKGNIHVVRDGDWLRAEGTTLGADNGIALAAMMYAAECPGLARGPLDLLFTSDEEIGLTGAMKLDPAIVRGRILINLDNEDEGQLCVGCAGSTDSTITLKAARTPADAGTVGLRVKVAGFQGGHSGVDIHLPRGNAIRAVARVLRRVAEVADVRLVAFTGGNKRNAIPRESTAEFLVPAAKVDEVRRAVDEVAEHLRKLHADRDAGFSVQVAGVSAGEAWPAGFAARVADLVLALPCGVLAMSPSVPGLVETSNSVGTAETAGDEVRLGSMTRSSFDPASAEVVTAVRAAARLAGAEVTGVAGYPGWQPDLKSKVLAAAQETHRRVFDKDAQIVAVHAGLECGILGERVPGMDMVSFGPDIKGPHAPGERVHVGSVDRFWTFLAAVLDDLSK